MSSITPNYTDYPKEIIRAEITLLKQTFRMMEFVEDDIGYRPVEYLQWTEDLYAAEHIWQDELHFLERYSSTGYCMWCTRMILFNEFIKKWRYAFNLHPDIFVKNEVIIALESRTAATKQKANDDFHLCGCTDFRQRDIEDEEWSNYQTFGPGLFTEVPNDQGIANGPTMLVWTLTPHVSPEDFEQQFNEKMHWRHNLFDLIEGFEESIAYLKRVPHKNYQDAYFLLSSHVMPQHCAQKILEFL